ncbi:hypothetical protein CTAM01_07171 [Colletotrichum tamarilloi]|uniref:C2H2-type domain-containing protein n=1 Tax=Colletotrichum tamarilloi TaxID=1209934 RepID=A0ABQ9RAB0_9PEZI|nr:uncharacterized protein CTAM01_07171 [Colletotrichum tamarilloi]KAK1499250.1 hypothetical protein CTAM01_07171 [Colletotrichum tamarilloi]
MAKSIMSAVLETNNRFSSVLPVAQDPEPHPLNQYLRVRLADEKFTFGRWARLFNAHKINRNSLDYRLRDASKIKDQTLTFVNDYLQTLSNTSKSVKDLQTALSSPDGHMLNSLTQGNIKVYLEANPDDVPPLLADLARIVSEVSKRRSALWSLEKSIQTPDPWYASLSSELIDTSAYEAFDIQHVSTKFKGIEDYLAQRLGKALSRRRQYFKYRKVLHERLSQPVDDQAYNITNIQQDTMASSISDRSQKVSESTICYDLSVFSSDEFVPWETRANDPTSRPIPDLPEEAQDGPFECQFCYMRVRTRDYHTWRQHVYDDLRPYSCLAKDCEMPDIDFFRSRDWMKHMVDHHFSTFYCNSGCGCTFSSEPECRTHLKTRHSDELSRMHKDHTNVTMWSDPVDNDVQLSCPFCLEKMPLENYEVHVGKHQQELALFALPNNDDYTSTWTEHQKKPDR